VFVEAEDSGIVQILRFNKIDDDDFSRRTIRVCRRTGPDRFPGRGMTGDSLKITSRMRQRGLKIGDARKVDGVRLMVMLGPLIYKLST